MNSKRKSDAIEDQLQELKLLLPPARHNLTEEEKDELIRQIGGPSSVGDIQNAARNLPKSRFFWIFNAIDPQLLVDILSNDMKEALKRARNNK